MKDIKSELNTMKTSVGQVFDSEVKDAESVIIALNNFINEQLNSNNIYIGAKALSIDELSNVSKKILYNNYDTMSNYIYVVLTYMFFLLLFYIKIWYH